MNEATWKTNDGKMLKISEMDVSHIQNCIRLLQIKMPDLPEEDDYLTADHWSLDGAVLFVPGKPWARQKIKEFKKELAKRHNFFGKAQF